MLLSIEVAVEYWLSLTWSPQAQWLCDSTHDSPLRDEVNALPPDLPGYKCQNSVVVGTSTGVTEDLCIQVCCLFAPVHHLGFL